MNKISKKIVSLVTMAAFALTLVPAAAFATPGQADADTTATVTAVDYDTAKVEVKVGQTDLGELQDKTGSNIVVWATDSNNDVVPAEDVTYTLPDGKAAAPWADAAGNDFAVLDNPTSVSDVVTVEATFANPGTYTLHAAVNDLTGQNLADMETQEIGEGTPFTRANFADRSKSEYGVFKDNKLQDTAAVNINKNLTTTFKINDWRGQDTTSPLQNVRVWAEDSRTDAPTSYLTVNGQTVGTDYMFNLTNVVNEQTINVQFSAGGTYTLYAEAQEENGNWYRLIGKTVVTVTDTTEIDEIELIGRNNQVLPYDEQNETFTLDLTDNRVRGGFVYGGSDVYTLDGTAFDNGVEALNQELTFSTENTDVIEFVDADKTVNTGNTGTFELAFSMQSQKNAVITITDTKTGNEYNVRIKAVENGAANINRTVNGGYVIASTDDNFAANIDNNLNKAVQFAITDEKGDPMTGWDAIADQPAAHSEWGNHSDYVRVLVKEPGSTVTADDFELVNRGDHYTLDYVGDNSENDLIPGNYSVRVTLRNGGANDNATVDFTAAEFGKVEDINISMEAWNNPDLQQKPTDGGYDVDDEITLGQTIFASATYVDGNGIEIAAPKDADIVWGFDGKAVREFNTQNGVFTTAYDTPANESLLGTQIIVTAFDQKNKNYDEKVVTVVDSYSTYDLEFDPTNGPINEDNKVTVSIVDPNGDVATKINNGTISAYVANSSDPDAKVSVKEGSFSQGKGTLTLYSDRETTVDVVVAVKAGSANYYETLEYTFGQEDPLADQTVVMTIGSTEYVVNNNVITGDAAPYVDSNWRTMVPIRALMEAFDAEVVWDEANPDVVTVNYDGGTQIIMNVGDETYTINGEEGEMDTVPVNNNGRVYVPIRFVAEGIGFHVTPLYDANGLTASVVFQR